MENSIKMDDLGGKPTIFGNSHMYTASDLEEVATVVGLFFYFFFSEKKRCCNLWPYWGPRPKQCIPYSCGPNLQQLLQGSNKIHSKYWCWDATIAGWFL